MITLVVEEAILLVFITWLGFNSMLIKVIAQVIVIVLNYVISKLVVFKESHNMQTNTTRDKTIDFIKGILILFVILGHTTLGLTDMYSFDDTMNGIANVIYSFHMPCFIAVSGFLYSEYVGNASQGIF